LLIYYAYRSDEEEGLKARCHYRSAKVDNVVYCLEDDVYVKVLVHCFLLLLLSFSNCH